MKRREFIAGLGGAAAWPVVARAQQQTKPILGFLDSRSWADPEAGPRQVAPAPDGPRRDAGIDAFFQGLAEVGFVEDRDFTIVYRTTSGHSERVPALVADLVRQRPAVINASDALLALALKAATRDIPIIFVANSDPVKLGLVASLNRPGGNLTGLIVPLTEIAEKRLQLLHEAVPTTETIAFLVGNANARFNQVQARNMQSAARTLGLRLLVLNVTADSEITPVFTTLVEQGAGAVLTSNALEVFFRVDEILSHAARLALPTMCLSSSQARAGALLSYGPDYSGVGRQKGVYTGRILKGEKPGDLPVQQTTRFTFAINLKTAKALGLSIPPNLLAIADEVIE